MFLRNSSVKKKDDRIKLLTDKEIIHAYKQNNEPSLLGELFERYTHLVFGVCLKHLKDVEESKDAVMQVFEQLPKKLNTFEIANFKSWIFTVSRNHCLMILRKKTAHRKHHVEIYEDSRQSIMENNGQKHPFVENEHEEKISRMKRGLEKLKEEQKKCIELLYLQQKSYKEVAEITGYDLKKVKSCIQNGKRNLRIYMENQ